MNIEYEINEKLPDIIREAGKIASKYFINKIAKITKEDDTIVTEADTSVQKYIIDELNKLSISFPIIAEEDNFDMNIAKEVEYIWVIDPIDGTSQFSSGLNNWVIAIALLKNFEPCAGWIYQPVLNDLYYAPINDINAYYECNNEKTIINKINTPTNYILSKKDTIYFGSRTFQEYKPSLTKARYMCLGSLTVHAIQTIIGNSIAAFSFDNKVWDICAVAEIAKRVKVEIKYTSGKNINYKSILNSRDKSLEEDLFICHENIFPIIKSLFVRINTFDVNPIKKWINKFNHYETLYFAMVKIIFPISLIIAFIRTVLGIFQNIEALNIIFSFLIILYFSICWWFSRKELRGKNYKYNAVYFIFYLIENICIQITITLLLLLPSFENRQIFYIFSSIYLFCRLFLVIIGVTLNDNFKFLIYTVIGFIILYFIPNSYIWLEYILSIIFIYFIIKYAINMHRWLKLKYLK
ncbi:MAG: inositol monophosphatase family protein [Treponema sp.]|nr:inositol monophosphatase family protein [Treponema sp.]